MSPETTITPRKLGQVISLVANTVLAIALPVVGFLYYQSNRDLEAQKTSVSALQTELAKEAARASELKSDLNSARVLNQSLIDKSTQLQTTILSNEQALTQEKIKAESAQLALEREKARLPAVPVRIEMRRSAMGRGLVAMLSNLSAKQLPVIVATQNPTTRAAKQFTLQIAPGLKVEIGYQEGWEFASGDRVQLRSASFEDVQYTVP
jgi:predicted RNase H-like nuclease (RuvC/YqgF family)